jgi:hypothetical protein
VLNGAWAASIGVRSLINRGSANRVDPLVQVRKRNCDMLQCSQIGSHGSFRCHSKTCIAPAMA